MCLCNSVSQTWFSLGQLRHKHFQDYSFKVVYPCGILQQLISAKGGVGWGGMMIFGEAMSDEAKYKGCRNKTSSSVSPLP